MAALLKYKELTFEYMGRSAFGYENEIEAWGIHPRANQIVIPTVSNISEGPEMAPEFFEISPIRIEDLKDEGYELTYHKEELCGEDIAAGKVGQEKIADKNDKVKVYLFLVRIEQNDGWKKIFFKNFEDAKKFHTALEGSIEDFYKDPSKYVKIV